MDEKHTRAMVWEKVKATKLVDCWGQDHVFAAINEYEDELGCIMYAEMLPENKGLDNEHPDFAVYPCYEVITQDPDGDVYGKGDLPEAQFVAMVRGEKFDTVEVYPVNWGVQPCLHLAIK